MLFKITAKTARNETKINVQRRWKQKLHRKFFLEVVESCRRLHLKTKAWIERGGKLQPS